MSETSGNRKAIFKEIGRLYTVINIDRYRAEEVIEERRSKKLHRGVGLEPEQKGRAQGSKSSRRNYNVSEEQDVHRVITRVPQLPP
jgi:hypothetical protein